MLRDVIFYLGLMTPVCFETLIVKLDFSNAACIKSAVSKTLGLGIVVGSSLVKLPQVLKIAGAGSAEGISFTSVLLELVAITFSGAYGFSNKFPFNAYGESVFLAIQTGLIALLVLSYTRGKLQALVFAALYAGKSAFLLMYMSKTKCCMLANQSERMSLFLVTSSSCTGHSSCASAVKF